MARARQAILAAGGAERTNVFTRAQLALFGQVPWRAVPVMPLEIMHLPLWFPFHLSKVSYWSRTVIVPLLVLMALRPVARNPRGVAIQELFRTPPAAGARLDPRALSARPGAASSRRSIECCAWSQPAFPRAAGAARSSKAVRFVTERLNGDDGLGGIYPAIANSVMMFDTLGYPPDHPDAAIAWRGGAQAAGGAGRTAPTASPACRRSGTPASPDTRWRRPARIPSAAVRLAGCRAADHGCGRRLGGAPARTAAGRLGVPVRATRTTRMWTTPRWSACCCIATAILALRRGDRARRATGSSACSHPTAAGARSSRRTRISI